VYGRTILRQAKSRAISGGFEQLRAAPHLVVLKLKKSGARNAIAGH
jgi:hypothetical protein